MDGANVEMCEEAGRDNMFIFGMNVEEVNDLKSNYTPQIFINQNTELKQCLEQIRDGYFSPGQSDLFQDIYNSVVYDDRYMLCADFADYIRAQECVDKTYKDQLSWAKKVVINIASFGKFSSDGTIEEYAREIWNAQPCLNN